MLKRRVSVWREIIGKLVGFFKEASRSYTFKLLLIVVLPLKNKQKKERQSTLEKSVLNRKLKVQSKHRGNVTSPELRDGDSVTSGGTQGLSWFRQPTAKAVRGCDSRM